MTISAQSESQPQHDDNTEAESLRLKQELEQQAKASFQATYSAITDLFNVKQKKYQKTMELAFLEGRISLQAIAVFAILMLLTSVFLATLWCLLNVAIVIGVMQLSSSLWLGLLVAAGINVLLVAILFRLIRKVKAQVGFNRTKRVIKGD